MVPQTPQCLQLLAAGLTLELPCRRWVLRFVRCGLRLRFAPNCEWFAVPCFGISCLVSHCPVPVVRTSEFAGCSIFVNSLPTLALSNPIKTNGDTPRTAHTTNAPRVSNFHTDTDTRAFCSANEGCEDKKGALPGKIRLG